MQSEERNWTSRIGRYKQKTNTGKVLSVLYDRRVKAWSRIIRENDSHRSNESLACVHGPIAWGIEAKTPLHFFFVLRGIVSYKLHGIHIAVYDLYGRFICNNMWMKYVCMYTINVCTGCRRIYSWRIRRRQQDRKACPSVHVINKVGLLI